MEGGDQSHQMDWGHLPQEWKYDYLIFLFLTWIGGVSSEWKCCSPRHSTVSSAWEKFPIGLALEFLPYETRVSSVWNCSANPYWDSSFFRMELQCQSVLALPLSAKKLQRLPNRLPINYDKQVGSVVRDSCGSDLSRLCGLLLLSLLLKFKFGRTILL